MKLSDETSLQQHKSRVLLPHPDSSKTLCWIVIPRCIATASVLSFSISPAPKAHMETVWSYCVTLYANLSALYTATLGFILAPCCLHAVAAAIYFEMWIISFTRMIKRWAAAPICVFDKLETVQQGLISNVKRTVFHPFSRATGDKHCKTCLEVYLFPL